MSEQSHFDEDDWLEQQHPESPKPSDDELIAHFFPANLEAQRLFDDKIGEWQVVAEDARREMRAALWEIRRIEDAYSRWFCTEALKISPAAKQLREAHRQIARLGRLKQVANRIFNGESQDGSDGDSSERVARARQVPILDVISSVLETKKAGKYFAARCPFHDDKNPSLVIYPDQNRFHCYGCQKHGDSIEFVKLHWGFGFKQAVEYLTQGGWEDERRRTG